MLRCLLPVLLSACAVAPDRAAGEVLLATDEVVLPARRHHDYFLVRTRLDGRGPFHLLLDTGTDYLTLTPEAARRLGPHRPTGIRRMRGANGDLVPVLGGVHVASLHLGPAELRDVHALVVDLGAIGRAMGHRLDGLLGIGPFADCLLTLDYPGDEVRLSSGSLPPVDHRRVLPLTVAPVPVVHATLGGETVPLLIDSGCGWQLALPEALGEDTFREGARWWAESVSISGQHARRSGVLRHSLQLGGYELHRRRAVLTPGMAKIGSRLLRHFRVTLDQANGRVELELRPRRRAAEARSTGTPPRVLTVESAPPRPPGL